MAAAGGWRGAVSFILVGLTLLLAAGCIFILSSVLEQTRLASIAIDGVNISVRRLVSVGDQWRITREQIAQEAKLRDAARNDSIKLNLALTNAENELAAKKEHLDQLLQILHRRVDATEPPIAAVNLKGYPDQLGAIGEARPQLHKDHPELDAFVDDVVKAYADYTSAESARDSASGKLAAVGQEIKALEANISGDTTSLNSAFDLIKKDMDAASRAKVENALYELYFNSQLTTLASTSLISMEPDNLTLLLVIMMGVLGSALQMTHAYCVKNQAITLPGYLLRISLGAITALVMFIVAKAGVPVLTDTSRLGGDAPINPYFVAFLAIVSGLLSESALANVQAQGARLLGQGPAAPDRWARHDLNDDLKAQPGLSAAALADHLGVDVPTMTAMLGGDKAMDDEAQKLTSIYLRTSQRDLFTDIPPPKP
ncbi:MAG TPA: hypothetical protein VII40_16550 [Xanthobacteraceae bacterium]